jgi:hypothetical protein
MDLRPLNAVHYLPLWFLIFSLFLPRIALLMGWFEGLLLHFQLNGLVALLFAALLPRVLVLFLIFVDQGISVWFVIHLVVAVLVWGNFGSYRSRRQRDG